MFGKLFTGLRRALQTSAEPRDRKEELEAYREFVVSMSQGKSKGEVAIVRHADTTAVVIAELLRVGREHVVIFGESLDAEVFLSTAVRAAMIGFLERSPEARVTVITNEPNYRTQLLAFQDHVMDGARITVLPATRTVTEQVRSSFVIADTVTPSVWYRPKEKAGEGFFQFYSADTGPKLRRIADGIIAGFGSPS